MQVRKLGENLSQRRLQGVGGEDGGWLGVLGGLFAGGCGCLVGVWVGI